MIEAFNCDAIQVINLDRSPARWERISKHFNESGYLYQRFRAVDGYNVIIQNMNSRHSFTGLSLKDKNSTIDVNTDYAIYCDGDSGSSVAFVYKYHGFLGSKSLTAGEYGCWCSHFAIWQEARKNKCSNIIVVEDDVVVKQNLTAKFEDFVERVPAYDFFMMDPTFLFINKTDVGKNKDIISSNKGYVDEREDIVRIQKDWDFWGTSGYAMSANAIAKITDFAVVTHPIDTFLAHVASERLIMPYNLSVYMSSGGLLGLSNDASEICVMGRGFGWHSDLSNACHP